MTCSKANFAASSVTLCFPQARVALPLNTFLWGDQADAIEDGNDAMNVLRYLLVSANIDALDVEVLRSR